MKAFRRKLAVILHDSELNKIRGSPIYHQPKDEENASDSDIMELPSLEGKQPHELVDEICKYIMSINDAKSLEQASF